MSVTPGFMADIESDGVTYRPLHSGELRKLGDVFYDYVMGDVRPELPQFIGTPQDGDPSPLEQSYRPVVREIPLTDEQPHV